MSEGYVIASLVVVLLLVFTGLYVHKSYKDIEDHESDKKK